MKANHYLKLVVKNMGLAFKSLMTSATSPFQKVSFVFAFNKLINKYCCNIFVFLYIVVSALFCKLYFQHCYSVLNDLHFRFVYLSSITMIDWK